MEKFRVFRTISFLLVAVAAALFQCSSVSARLLAGDSLLPRPSFRFSRARLGWFRHGVLPKGPVPSSGPSHPGSPPPLFRHGVLPRGAQVPPSGPSHPGEPPSMFRHAVLPRGVPVPPSGPSHPGEPPYVFHHAMLPRGVPIPPSGPSHAGEPPIVPSQEEKPAPPRPSELA